MMKVIMVIMMIKKMKMINIVVPMIRVVMIMSSSHNSIKPQEKQFVSCLFRTCSISL